MIRKQVHVPEKMNEDIVKIANDKGLKAAEIYRRAIEIGIKIIKEGN